MNVSQSIQWYEDFVSFFFEDDEVVFDFFDFVGLDFVVVSADVVVVVDFVGFSVFVLVDDVVDEFADFVHALGEWVEFAVDVSGECQNKESDKECEVDVVK